MLSSTQPVTATAPATPVVLFAGVSKLPTGTDGEALATLTWTCCGDPGAPAAVTVMTPLGPCVAVTWNDELPVPEVGETMMFG